MKAATLGVIGMLTGFFSDLVFHDTMQTVAIVAGAIASVFGAINGYIEYRRKKGEEEENE